VIATKSGLFFRDSCRYSQLGTILPISAILTADMVFSLPEQGFFVMVIVISCSVYAKHTYVSISRMVIFHQ
jgi:hypothetical protein